MSHDSEQGSHFDSFTLRQKLKDQRIFDSRELRGAILHHNNPYKIPKPSIPMNQETLRENTIQSFQHVKQHIAQLEHALIQNQAEIAQLKDQLQSLSIALSQLNGSLDKAIAKPKKRKKPARKKKKKN
jgi:uncharacterized coiled-coil protein SlyX